MLIVLPSTPATEKASDYLKEKGYEHQVIAMPESIDYKTGSDIGIYTESPDRNKMLIELTQQRFVVMRVFKEFHLD
ncbi:MAG: hypothetical protein K2X66_17545 [Cyanobacteria bacterium]|nr:hypothetical protein [Cyanobacteriota bacterium]